MPLRWTKLQDFCLRLGLLKVLVAALPTSRTSLARERVLSSLEEVLFRELDQEEHQELLDRVETVLDGESANVDSVADALLVVSGIPSWGQPIRKSTIYKLLEWGKNVGLVVKGNRISERGLVLRELFDSEAANRFVNGEATAWNPFRLTGAERAFFFYHLGEGDELLWRIAYRVGEAGQGREFTVSDDSAYKLTLTEMKNLLDRAGETAAIPDMPKLRTVRELARAIEHELHPEDASIGRGRYGPPSPKRPGRSRGGNTKKSSSSKKNADHQTIPRFEQLVDLGFLDKPVDDELTGRKLDRARRSWSFTTTSAAERFSESVDTVQKLVEPEWKWRGLGEALGNAGIANRKDTCSRLGIDAAVALFLDAYETLRRPAGHTPFESCALLALVRALEAGHFFEVTDLHAVMLEMKRAGLLEGKIHFAAGNEVDRMFVDIQSGFREEWNEAEETQDLPWPETS